MNRETSKVDEDVWVKSVCHMCYNACGIRVHRVNGVAVKIEGDADNPNSRGRVCAKGNAGMMTLYDPYRVTKPLKRTNPEKGIGVDPKWVEISWDEALDTVADRVRKVRQDDPRKIVLANLDFSALVYLRPMFSAWGTPNIWHAAGYFCGNGLHPILAMTQGSSYCDPDLTYCNYCILMGTQSGFLYNSNAMHLVKEMADARMRGMKLVAVDPVCTYAASKADEWVPIRPGTDAALALGMLNVLLNELGIYDQEFLKKHTNGPYLVGPEGYYVRDGETQKALVWDAGEGMAKTYDDPTVKDWALEGSYRVDGVDCQPAFQRLKDHVRKYTLERVSQITTIPGERVRRIAQEFGEAARVGSTIVVQGKELPYRPALVNYNRGAIAHKHGMLTGMAIQLLNLVVGAVDVPGGILGCTPRGHSWEPREGPDGIIMPSPFVYGHAQSYPEREVKPPQSLDLLDLFPVAAYSSPLMVEGLLHPEKYQLPYRPEIILHSKTNLLMTMGNPQEMAEALKKIPFMVSFTREMDETVEFADIVIPDAHYLEKVDPFQNVPNEMHILGPGRWYWTFRPDAVEPPPGVRQWAKVFLDIAERAGFVSDIYITFNTALTLKEPYRLDPAQKYTWEEILDRWAKSWCGPEYGLDWFKEHGTLYLREKTIEEAYPRPFIKPRAMIYFEHFKRAGEEVKRVTQEMGLSWWDTSDYQPLPDWKPCPAHEDHTPGYDLQVANYKLPIHTFSVTAENPYLNELAEHHPYAYNILLNSQTAKKKGIRDGDELWVESVVGYRVRGKVKVTECIHPEVVGIAGTFGHWTEGQPIAKGKGVHFNTLLSHRWEYIDMVSTALDSCIKVKVYKKEVKDG